MCLDFCESETYDFVEHKDAKDVEIVLPCAVTYYRHPTKGQFKVDTFLKAMEVYGIEMAMGTDKTRQQAWVDVAYKMHDAPCKVQKN